MKKYILYLIVSIVFLNCKTEKKETHQVSSNHSKADTTKVQRDTIETVKKVVPQKFKSLKEKLKGTIYFHAYEISDFEGLSSGGFMVGSTHNDEHIYKGESYSIDVVRGHRDIVKYIIFAKEVNNNNENLSEIIDLLEMEKETDVYAKYPDKNIGICSDVLLNNKRAPELFALANYTGENVLTEVYKVWRANRETGTLEEVKDLSNITVVDEDS